MQTEQPSSPAAASTTTTIPSTAFSYSSSPLATFSTSASVSTSNSTTDSFDTSPTDNSTRNYLKREIDVKTNLPASKRLQQMATYGADDSPTTPSRVLLIRNLAPTVTEMDIENLVSPFSGGRPPKIYLHGNGSHAFVEFACHESAASALQFFKAHPTQLKGSIVQPTFSRRDNVVTMEEKIDLFTKVLHVSVTNIIHPVDIELINFLFSKHGAVEKIVTFTKSPTMFQALVQFTDSEEARGAMKALNNRNIYDGCNSIQIQPSRNSELTVKGNSSKSWDFTIPSSAPSSQPNLSLPTLAPAVASQVPSILPTPQNASGVVQMMPQMAAAAHLRAGPYTPYGMTEMTPAQVGASMSHSFFRASRIQVPYDKLPRELRDVNLESANPNQTPVIIVYNLSATDITVMKLYNLFSLYGVVLRVKILREKPDTALIQFSDPLYATIAYNFLQGAPLFQKEAGIQICYSKNKEVKMPPQGSSDTDDDLKRTRAFQMSEQRYGGSDDIDKYLRAACRPTCTLFVANIHEDATESELKALFQEYGEVQTFEIRPPKEGSRKRMAFFEMESEREAIMALCCLHNCRIRDSNIKLAFSKSHILNAARAATSAAAN